MSDVENFCPGCGRAYVYPMDETKQRAPRDYCIPGECTAPLHVQVAVALGWTEIRLEPRGGHNFTPMWFGNRPADDHVYADVRGVGAASYGVPNFDTSWCQMGPLIERFCEGVNRTVYDSGLWNAVERGGLIPLVGRGRTPLIAVCMLVLALKEVGKL